MTDPLSHSGGREGSVETTLRLVAIVQELSRARSVERVQEIVRRAARTLTGADGATFVLREGDQCFYADEDAIVPLWKGKRFPIASCVSGWVMEHHEVAVIPDVFVDARVPVDAYRPTFVRSMAMVPIRAEAPIGAIGAYWATPRAPTTTEVTLLAALADSAAIALENVGLVQSLEERIGERTEALLAARRAEAALRDELEHRRVAEVRLRETEAQLRHAQKMDALGRLAGGVAHDFNNLLSAILSYSSMLLEDLPPGDPSRDDIAEIHRAGERAASLTRQLLGFSRSSVVDPAIQDPGTLVAGFRKMLARLVGEDVDLAFLPRAGTGTVLVDAGQFEQVLMNLVVNARDATPPGGKITVEVRDVFLDAQYAELHAEVVPGPYVMLAVSDDGAGMSAETRARIFEPFFTTKADGRGTGLGLSTVYAIVKQSGGHIWVYSEPGVGTSFKIYLPVHDAVSVETPVPRPSARRRSGTETVLAVEDDAQVRAATSAILRRHGYEVLEARSPAEALRVVDGFPRSIHLLVTDVVMPEMGGAELARRVVAARPDLRVLFVSGYSDGAAVRQGLVGATDAFLEKPITPDVLLGEVRRMLDNAA